MCPPTFHSYDSSPFFSLTFRRADIVATPPPHDSTSFSRDRTALINNHFHTLGRTRVRESELSEPVLAKEAETRAGYTFVVRDLRYHQLDGCETPPIPSQDLSIEGLVMGPSSPPKAYPGHELSIPQLLYALRTKLEHGELLETTGSDPSQISEIEDLSHRVHAHIRFALNGFVPINQRLPPEVLGIIPSFLIHDRDRILATHVCRHWRTAFLSTPSLWNNIDTFEHPEKTKVYLERSGDTPLNISISSDKLWKPGASASLRMLRPLPNRCRTVRFLQNQAASDVFDIIQNPCPHLVELYLEMPNGTRFHGIDDLGKLPSLTSLTLIGNMRHLRFSQPFNLRKLGVGYNKSRFRLESLLELLEKIPLLEEFEFHTPTGAPHFVDPPDARSPVVLKHLQRIVFRGVRSEFPLTLCSLITYPSHTRVILTYHLSYDTLISLPSIHPHRMFPYGMRLSTSSPPKSIRYQEVQDDDLLETRCYIDLISLDGHHISIENRHGWPHKSLLQETKSSTLEGIQIQCFEFLCTLNLSFVERFCIQQSNPDPGALEEVTGYMPNLRTLITVNGYPYGVFMGLEVHEPENVWCPLLRRLVVRQDLEVYSMHWHMLLPIIHDRAARGFPLEQVILTSSFNELPEEPEVLIQELERTVEVTYDLGRNTFGWEWWNV